MKTRLTLPLVVLLSACNATTDSTVASTADELTTAQCTFEGFDSTAQACFDAFDACKAAAGAVEADCKTALDACLPAAPAGSHPGHGAAGDGSCGGGGVRPPRPDGGEPPPGGPGGHGGPGGKGGRGGPGGGFAIDSAVLQGCRDAYTACIAADATAEQSCRATEHTCVKDAFAAQFETMCTTATAACSAGGSLIDAAGCAKITERCAQGVGGRPQGPDAGTCPQ